jgi:hypothetical protein
MTMVEIILHRRTVESPPITGSRALPKVLMAVQISILEAQVTKNELWHGNLVL